jgi:hypothetical protein
MRERSCGTRKSPVVTADWNWQAFALDVGLGDRLVLRSVEASGGYVKTEW